MQIVDPAEIAKKYLQRLKESVTRLERKLQVVGFIASGDPPSISYANATRRVFTDAGFNYDLRHVKRLELEAEIIIANADQDCNSDCFGLALIDDCGICSGGLSEHEANSDIDCTGDCLESTPGGDGIIDAFYDDCGICSGGTSGRHDANSDKDCAGECFGLALEDDCGVCSGGTSAHEANSDKDCNGDCNGAALIDTCGVCSGGNNEHVADSDIDCHDDCFGSALIDDCGICSGGLSDHDANSDKDCNGECDGTANYDDCNICSGGSTGLVTNADLDDCSVCFGNNVNKDCNDECFGTAFEDGCGECSGGMHGANRLGGNSLSDLLVFGKLAGDGAADYIKELSGFPSINKEKVISIIRNATEILNRESGMNPYLLHEELQEVMQNNVGIVRSAELLTAGIEQLDKLKESYKEVKAAGASQFNPGWHEALAQRNMIITAEATARSALLREESRGAHTRIDFPDERDDFLNVNVVTYKGEDGSMKAKKVNRTEPPAELNRIANLSLEQLEQEIAS